MQCKTHVHEVEQSGGGVKIVVSGIVTDGFAVRSVVTVELVMRNL